jgi:hypothetical protein
MFLLGTKYNKRDENYVASTRTIRCDAAMSDSRRKTEQRRYFDADTTRRMIVFADMQPATPPPPPNVQFR